MVSSVYCFVAQQTTLWPKKQQEEVTLRPFNVIWNFGNHMATVTFDTLKFVETLKEAGVPETQAKAFSTAVQESHKAAELATKGDIADLRHEIKELDLRIHGEMLLLKWMLGILIAGVASLILKSFFGT